jgi:type IV secretion system protein VirB9
LLNFSMDGDDVVIHRVVRQLIVRRGKLVGRIVNKGFTGSGERLKSGTVSPTIERLDEGRP